VPPARSAGGGRSVSSAPHPPPPLPVGRTSPARPRTRSPGLMISPHAAIGEPPVVMYSGEKSGETRDVTARQALMDAMQRAARDSPLGS
jgi:hypothetical protein